MRRIKLKNIPIREVSKSELTPYYGKAYQKHGVVRADLSPRVKRHVSLHERIHVKYRTGEIATNLLAGVRDPVGWSATAIATLKDSERRAYYKGRVKHFFKKKKH